MSSTMSEAREPLASPIPRRSASQNAEEEAFRPVPKPKMPQPKLRFEVRDLSHPGALLFLEKVNPTRAISDAVTIVVQSLYEPFTGDVPSPAVRSITLVLKPMGGVAYTTGNELDDDHKEIHFSLDYIVHAASSGRGAEEIRGVLVHEMVHVWQWNGKGKAPSGLIEGIADFIRLKAAYAPPHWERKPGPSWDAGYEKTAYFLEWLEDVYGTGKVGDMNEKLRQEEYQSEEFWKALFGQSIETLWKAYKEEHENREGLKQTSQDEALDTNN
ncbi:MAG: hypothetical protein LQ340_002232 [Diploschistes diacapsis]|nr:MAG: hypothetical protein LQ340_002232 [Diploschistes diacapsis]